MSVRLGVIVAVAVVLAPTSLPDSFDSTMVRRPQLEPNTQPQRKGISHTPATPKSEAIKTDLSRFALLLEFTSIATRNRLRDLLIARTSVPADDLIAASKWERELSRLLSADDYALYERLRNAGDAYEHVRAYGAQLPPDESLTLTQMRHLLIARAQYADAVSGLDLRAAATADLPTMEREYAQDISDRELAATRERYHSTAAAVLTEAQWLSLREFEDQPHTAELGG